MKLPVCVILSGGKSSRFGCDKTLVKFNECDTLTEFCVNRYGEIFEKIFVSAKNDKFGGKFRLLLDKSSEFSPMNALFSILENFKNEKVFIVPADMPLVEFSTIYSLYENSANEKICVAKESKRTHFLCGFFSGEIADLACSLAKKNEHKIENLCKKAGFKSVEFQNSGQFLNINYQSDLLKVKR